MANTIVNTNYWHSRWGNLALGALALLIMYLVASRALDTGSLGQYGLTFLLLIVGINRLVRASHK